MARTEEVKMKNLTYRGEGGEKDSQEVESLVRATLNGVLPGGAVAWGSLTVCLIGSLGWGDNLYVTILDLCKFLPLSETSII